MWQQVFDIFVLLLAANGAPILAAWALGARAAWAVDLGRCLPGGRPLLGPSKTWRGLLAALLGVSLVAVLLGYSASFGLIFAALAMTGDLVSSFIKRRLGVAPSDRSPGLDQLPEALLPSLYAVWTLELPWWWVLLLPLLFTAAQVLVSEPLFRMKIRRRPH